jgi:transposase
MLLKTILNRVQKHRSFVYGPDRLIEDDDGRLSIEIDIYPRANAKPICSGCMRRRPGYDRLPPRRFEFIPLWGILVYFVYTMRRVNCPKCGIVVEAVPWADGKSPLTKTYAWFLARWAKRMSWAETARAFRTSWDSVFRAVKMAVEWGRAHVDLSGITAIGVDEIAWAKGHKYMTVVYQIDAGRHRLLWISEHRRVKTLLRFFRWFGKQRTANLRYICSDMWKPYLKVIKKKATGAVHVLDRFHVAQHLSKAIDKVRAEETRQLAANGYEPVLKHSRWCLLKRPENLSEKQETKLRDLLKYNLRSVRAYLLKEDLQGFWSYVSPHWAGVFLDRWCTRVMRSRIAPMKQVARMLQAHRPLILNWFRGKGAISAASVEGMNGKAKVATRKAYGFRRSETLAIALYHQLGDLPEPREPHRFC